METTVQHLTESPQIELVREHCGEAEGRIMLAHSHAEAVRIKEEWCNQFRRECESELLINATLAYLDGIITRTWKEDQA